MMDVLVALYSLWWWVVSVATLATFVALIWLAFADGDLSLMWAEKFGKQAESLTGQVVWITGASSGIGEHLAYELAAVGCKLILSARRLDELERVKKQCLLSGWVSDNDIHLHTFDLADLSSHKKAVDDVIARYQKIDILVNNAGRSQRAPVLETSVEVDQKLIELNTIGTISLTKLVLPSMVKRKRGQIVVTSSLAGKMGSPLSASYSASKFALHGWYETTRIEVFAHNIDICMVCPGPVLTNILSQAFTGDVNKPFGRTMDKSLKRVSSARCAALMAVAMANRLDEVWITLNPILFFAYVMQYMPTLGRRLSKRVGMRTIQKLRDVHD